jgi:type IX secretion system PorP/SprF family membrane protein
MKNVIKLLIVVLGFIGSKDLYCQEIPLFSQKLTNSFLYNPALAGLSTGSFTYSYRRNYALVEDAPQDHFASFHTPIADMRFGVGVNAYYEEISFLKNSFTSVAFAYHLRLSKLSTLSFGVAGESSMTKVYGSSNTSINGVDPVMLNYQSNDPTFDVSFGSHYKSRYLSIGFAFNKLSTSWIDKTGSNLSNYFTSYVQGTIPTRNKKDSFEPFVSLRKFTADYMTWDVGAFYMVNDALITGLAYRKGNIVNATVGFKFPKNLVIGYAREVFGSNLNGFVGSTNEIVLRYDFNPPGRYKSIFSECKTDPYGVEINSRYRFSRFQMRHIKRQNKSSFRSRK